MKWKRSRPVLHVFERASTRLVLRPLCESDANDYVGSIDDEVMKQQGYTKATVDLYRRTFAGMVRDGYRGWPCNVVVRDPETGAFIGQYQLSDFSEGGDSASLGWWLRADARGRGLGTESLALVLDYAHDAVGIRRVIMGTDCNNARALAQISKSGASATHERPHLLPNGKTVTSRWFEHIARRPTQ